jgi:class 3 adenylate cyclase
MAEVPQTCYAKTADGAHIAYQVMGSGPLEIVELSSGAVSVSIDATNDQPEWRRYVERLAGFSRLVRFDVRGIGLSDPLPSDSGLTLEERVSDVLAILDDAGVERPAVLSATAGGYASMLLAATHPARVRALVLVHPVARVLRAPDYPWGTSTEMFDAALDQHFDPSRTDAEDIQAVAPSKAADPVFRDWWDKAGRRGASPTTARRQLAMLRDLDVRSVLPAIRAPTLVLQRRDNRFVVAPHGRYVAEHIPGASYVELPGADHLPWLGDLDTLVDEIEEFLTGSRPVPRPDRVLATVLFTDIVDSTAQASTMGDRAWRDRMDAHDAMVRRQLERFGGREVKTTGDGFLATFDSPARSIHCGVAIRDGAHQIGMAVRVGLHTGEIELLGNDVGGIAVHIGQRICTLAAAREVLVSRTVTDLVAGSGLQFDDRGDHQLKGVPGTWRLFAVRG